MLAPILAALAVTVLAFGLQLLLDWELAPELILCGPILIGLFWIARLFFGIRNYLGIPRAWSVCLAALILTGLGEMALALYLT
jgi:hypothetical protein